MPAGRRGGSLVSPRPAGHPLLSAAPRGAGGPAADMAPAPRAAAAAPRTAAPRSCAPRRTLTYRHPRCRKPQHPDQPWLFFALLVDLRSPRRRRKGLRWGLEAPATQPEEGSTESAINRNRRPYARSRPYFPSRNELTTLAPWTADPPNPRCALNFGIYVSGRPATQSRLSYAPLAPPRPSRGPAPAGSFRQRACRAWPPGPSRPFWPSSGPSAAPRKESDVGVAPSSARPCATPTARRRPRRAPFRSPRRRSRTPRKSYKHAPRTRTLRSRTLGPHQTPYPHPPNPLSPNPQPPKPPNPQTPSRPSLCPRPPAVARAACEGWGTPATPARTPWGIPPGTPHPPPRPPPDCPACAGASRARPRGGRGAGR